MSRIWDAFMFHDELDILECRIRELESVPNLVHVIVEADVTHQDNPKPSYLKDNWGRFEQWSDRIVTVWATDLPTVKDNPDPWAREHAQREWIGKGLIVAESDDVLIQSDVDEIPTALVARNLRPNGLVSLEQRLFCFAVDWEHPQKWYGPVATKVGLLKSSFGYMRDARNIAPHIPGGGWHLSWLGGDEANLRKLNAFCHPEVAERIHAGLEAGNRFLHNGIHVDGAHMKPVDVDATWPKWIRERKCPANWFRPR